MAENGQLYEWDIVLVLLVSGVITVAVAAWVCQKLSCPVIVILIGTLLILLNVGTLVMTFLK